MACVHIVITSNCETYEDYNESIDSAWSTREAAVRHIEGFLGMSQVSWRDPARKWSRDRWVVEYPEYPREEEYADDPEGWADCHDENGDLIPYWVSRRDAWIVELELDPVREGGEAR